MFTRLIGAVVGVAVAGMVTAAQAATIGAVFLFGDSDAPDPAYAASADNEILFQNILNNQNVLNNSARIFTDDIGLVGTTITSGLTAITSENLVGKTFLVTGYDGTNTRIYSDAELALISDFVSGGGSLILFGDGYDGFDHFTGLNDGLNTVLSTVGSTMRLVSPDLSPDTGTATLTSLTTGTVFAEGVNSWRTRYSSQVSLGSNGQIVIAGVADAGFFGTFVGYDNFEPPPPVPLPASLPLFLTAMGGMGLFGWLRRRRASANAEAV